MKKRKVLPLQKGGASLPFIIHATEKAPLYPTHTHGLTTFGFPEFLMDPLSFGAEGTVSRIIVSYKYFKKPENKDKLVAIKNGETVKLTVMDLAPDKQGQEPCVYCYRRVYPDFEMVKQAYVIESPGDIDPKKWFVQIYVEGDDYVLMDVYYRGGIKW